MIKKLSILSFLFVFSQAQAKLFQNTYISFEIPETWECKSFGTDWVCHSRLQERKVEALITSTAKIAGQNDTLDQYLSYLQQPKTWSNLRKEEITSKPIMAPAAKKVFINKFPWVDSIHKNSEIKSYISRYAGAVCCKDSSSQLGILVVLSAHEDHYTKYSGDFVKTINSLRVMDIEKAISKVRESQAQGYGAERANYLEGLFEESFDENLETAPSSEILGLEPLHWGLLILIVLVFLGGLKLRKRKRRRRSSRKK